MKRLAEHRADFNRIATEILLADADLALTLIEVAKGPHKPEVRAKTISRARRAYQEISKRRSSIQMSDEAARRLEAKLALVRQRLSGADMAGPDGGLLD